MICVECDELDRKFIEPGAARLMHVLRHTLTPDLEKRFDREESSARNAIFDHRYKDHKPARPAKISLSCSTRFRLNLGIKC